VRRGTNGGTAAGLVGSYQQVADRIRRFNDIGIETGTLYERNPNLGVVKTDAETEGTGRLRQW